MTASAAFRVKVVLRDPDQVQTYFRRNQLKAALVIPRDFGRSLARGEPAEAQLLLDGTDGITTSIALGYAVGISQAETRRLLENAGLVLQPPLEGRIRVRFNPGIRSARFIVPGLIAVILAIMAVMLTALTVAREWSAAAWNSCSRLRYADWK